MPGMNSYPTVVFISGLRSSRASISGTISAISRVYLGIISQVVDAVVHYSNLKLAKHFKTHPQLALTQVPLTFLIWQLTHPPS